MTLKKLLSQQGWLNIEAALLQEYPDQKNQLSSYETVYYQLLLLPEAETDLQIELKAISSMEPGTNYVDVCGKKQMPHVADAEINLCYALHYTPWAEWLAMRVSSKTLQSFSEPEVIAHCLYTMTVVSFEESEMDAEYEKLSERVDAVNLAANKPRQ